MQLFSYSDLKMFSSYCSVTVIPQCFSKLNSLHHSVSFMYFFRHIISFGSFAKISAQIIFLVTHFISSVSQLNVFSAESSFI